MNRTILALGLLLWIAPASADMTSGSAGPFAMRTFVGCDMSFMEAQAGACDPAPVDLGLTPAERSQAHLDRARRLLGLMRDAEVLKAANAAVETDPGNLDARLFRSRFRFSMPGSGSPDEDLNVILAVKPDHADALASRAYWNLQLRRLDFALADTNAALKAWPGHVDALRFRASIYKDMNRFELADQDLTAVIAATPTDPRPSMMRADIRLRRMDTAGALADLDRVVALSPRDLAALDMRSGVKLSVGDAEGALADLQLILGRPGAPVNVRPNMPAMARMAITRAMLLARLGRVEDAKADLDDLVGRGGLKFILKLQLHLRRNGFDDVQIDGKDTTTFRTALDSCLRQPKCGQGATQSL